MQALSLLIKPASGNCNMRCKYCFYADVTQSREQPNRGMMTVETLETIVEQALSEATEFCSFGFQGGEPMLAGPDFFRQLVAFQEKYNKNNIEIFNSIQTNGSLIDEGWATFFAEEKFLVGLSIDGEGEVHDMMRLDAYGNTTHSRCLKAAAALEKAGADFNVLSVLTKAYARHPDKAYNFYKSHGLRFIQLIPCLDGLWEEHGSNPFSLDAQMFGKFLCRFFDLWYEDFIRGDYYSVRMFDNWVRMLMGEPPENCGMSGYCQSYPVIEADGSVYPCDFYVLDEYRIGNVATDSFADMLGGEASQKFMAPSREIPAQCRVCEYVAICRNGCRRDREPLGAEPGVNYYCEGYKQFFAHALPRMRDIAAKMPRRG